MAGAPNTINATLYEKLNFIRDIAPVAGVTRFPLVIDVNPSVPVKTGLVHTAHRLALDGETLRKPPEKSGK